LLHRRKEKEAVARVDLLMVSEVAKGNGVKGNVADREAVTTADHRWGLLPSLKR
jgi:hypothetical protein